MGGTSILAAAEPSTNVDHPATLGPTAGKAAEVHLPVGALRAVHGLDLEQPARTKLRISLGSRSGSRLTRPHVSPQHEAHSPSSTGPQLTMPSLIAPSTTPSADADQPPSVPEAFQPKWRPTGKGRMAAVKATPDTSAAAEPAPVAVTKAKPVSSKAAPVEDATTKSVNESQLDDSPIVAAEKTPPAVEVAPAEPLKPLTRNQIYLRNKMRKVLTYYYRKPLNSRDNDAWEAMHGMLSYGLHSRIRAGGPRGESMTAIGWLCYNNPCKHKQLMRLNDQGEIRAQYGVGLQGHMGQFLAMLAQCNVDRTYPIRVEGNEFTIEDLIESEKETCYPNTELTFKLIGLMHYLPSDSQWVNDRGENWSIERLIEEELKQPIRGAACGGTHRLGGLSLAVKKRKARDEPIDGAWLKAKKFTDKYEQYAYRLQNSDGSFSTEWFRGPGREKDIDRRCRTTGHLLEWVLYQAEEDEIASYRVVKATNYLTNLLYSNSTNEWETGPLCHALHALAVYDKQVFQPHDKPTQTAQSGDRSDTKAKQNNSARRGTSRSRRR